MTQTAGKFITDGIRDNGDCQTNQKTVVRRQGIQAARPGFSIKTDNDTAKPTR